MYILCHHTHNSPPNFDSSNKTHGKERGGKIWPGIRLEGVIWKGEGAVDLEDQPKLFFSKEKERKYCKKRKRRRGRRGEGGWCLTFFKGIINSLTYNTLAK